MNKLNMNEMEKTVGIITMHCVENYGSYVQTLATYRFIKSLGYNPIVINYKYPNKIHLETGEAHNQKKYESLSISVLIAKIINKLRRNLHGIDKKLVKSKFDAFYRNLQLTREFISPEDLSENCPEFDIYISGSDQIWNPLYVGDDTSYLLSWVKSDKLKISFSSSFALQSFPSKYLLQYRKFLALYKSISVRESSDVCKSILGYDAEITLDPTFLLSKDEWREYINKSPIIEGEYILCYILSYKFNPYPYVCNLIEYVKNKTNMKVVFIDGSRGKYHKDWKYVYNCGPSDFLTLFYYASFVITTSFHGTAFSINFQKNFLSLINDDKNNDVRQLSLLSQFELKECLLHKNTPLNTVSIPSINYSDKEEKIEKLRKRSKDYLRNALSL